MNVKTVINEILKKVLKRKTMSKKSLMTVAVTHSCLNGEVITVFDNFEWNGEFTYEKYLELKKRYSEKINRSFNQVTIISKIDFDE